MSTEQPLTYYVMRAHDGDEMAIAYCATLTEAKQHAIAERGRDCTADLSIWTNRGGIVALMDRAGKLRRAFGTDRGMPL